MQEDMQAIIAIMQAQYDVYAALLDIANRKPEVLTHKDDAQALQALTRQEEELISRAAALEQDRLSHMQCLSTTAPKEAGEFTLNDLIAQANDMTAQALTLAGKRLMDCLNKLKRQNTLNRQLVEINMNFTSFMLDTITNRNAPTGVYGNTGTEVDGQEAGYSLFNSEV